MESYNPHFGNFQMGKREKNFFLSKWKQRVFELGQDVLKYFGGAPKVRLSMLSKYSGQKLSKVLESSKECLKCSENRQTFFNVLHF